MAARAPISAAGNSSHLFPGTRLGIAVRPRLWPATDLQSAGQPTAEGNGHAQPYQRKGKWREQYVDRPAGSAQVEVVGRVLEGLRIEFGCSDALLVGQVRQGGVEREPSRSVGMDVVRRETAITRPLVKCTAGFRPKIESRNDHPVGGRGRHLP
jgi:hypothetical protein